MLDQFRLSFLSQIATCKVRGIGTCALPESILAAVEATPRHEFIGDFRLNGKVYTPEDPDYLKHIYSAIPLIYADQEWSTNSDPAFILHLVSLLDLRPGERVLEIGSGTGWLSAIMARLVAPSGSVTGIEIAGKLVDRAREARRRLAIANVEYECGSVLERTSFEPCDKAIFTASAFALPEPVFDALAIGGIIGLPIRHRGLCDGFLFLRKESADSARSLESRMCKFVPIQGEEGDNTGIFFLTDELHGIMSREPVARTPLKLVEDGEQFLGAPLESFLSKIEPRRFVVLDLSATARNILWRKGSNLKYAFAFHEGESLALWHRNEIVSYGPRAHLLQRDLLAACHQWRVFGRPTELDFGLEIVRGQSDDLGEFEEQRGAFVYRWAYRSEKQEMQRLLEVNGGDH